MNCRDYLVSELEDKTEMDILERNKIKQWKLSAPEVMIPALTK